MACWGQAWCGAIKHPHGQRYICCSCAQSSGWKCHVWSRRYEPGHWQADRARSNYAVGHIALPHWDRAPHSKPPAGTILKMPAHPHDVVHITPASDQVGLIGIKRLAHGGRSTYIVVVIGILAATRQ